MKPFFIIIDGSMGSGKTTVAGLIHKKLPRTALVGTDLIKWFVSDFERTKRDNDITRNVLVAMCAEYLKNGVSILLAQGFLQSANRAPYIKLAKRLNVRLLEYRLEAPHEVLLQRLENRPKPVQTKTSVSKSRILENLRLHAQHRYSGAMNIDTSKMSAKTVADTILKDVRKRQK